MKRVVVTGIGALTPIGNDIQTFWDNLTNGRSGAGRITKFDPSAFRTQIACELKGFDPTTLLDRAELKRTDPFTQYALAAAKEAIEDSGLDFGNMNPYDTGVIWGSGQGGMLTFEEQVRDYADNGYKPRFSPFFIPKLISNMASGMISIKYGLMGINYTTVTACSSSNTAIMDALNYIRWGKAKVIITGGSESPLTSASFGGFCAMKAMTVRNDDPQTACRPFDIATDGFLMGEGAGALVLEEYEHAVARGATIYAEVAGAAMTADAYHITAPHPDGLGAANVMRYALEDAKISPDVIDYINVHGTSTPLGDVAEIKAIQHVFGEKAYDLHISSTKSMTGHLLGASGAIESIACLIAMKEGFIPPTINHFTDDPEIDDRLQLTFNEAVKADVNYALCNTFGFGGHNTSLILKKLDA